MTHNPILASDLSNILDHTESLWYDLKGGRIFITGGTGFFGRWLLESFHFANKTLRLKAQAVILTRNPQIFRDQVPHLVESDSIQLHHGELTDFRYPEGQFTHLIHAASELSSVNLQDPLGLLTTTLNGTRRVCDFASCAGVKKLLFTSSGAVYGSLSSSRTHFSENDQYSQLPPNSRSAYAEAKRMAELVCLISGQNFGYEVKIVRGFAFIGPFLSLQLPLAASSFLQSALHGKQLVVQGHGQNSRSYLYGADLAIWLWTILVNGAKNNSYNLGSDVSTTIQQLANTINTVANSTHGVEVLGNLDPFETPESYIPSIEKAKNDLDLSVFTPFEQAIERTLSYHRHN
jgi:nucleoside-diphosphate-sugar epimerase